MYGMYECTVHYVWLMGCECGGNDGCDECNGRVAWVNGISRLG